MPQLEWDETDVLTCLEVLPATDDYNTFYDYKIQQGDLRMSVTIWPYESIVSVSLSQRAAEIASWTLAVRGTVRRVLYKTEHLEFCGCVLIAGRFAYKQGVDFFDAGLFPGDLTMELSIKPHIRVAFA